ncbi:MAG: hypothetical protein HQK52_22260 [Oligoflexia bacterium]|nr:hypothetical protein [Oligoflexia bacterium]
MGCGENESCIDVVQGKISVDSEKTKKLGEAVRGFKALAGMINSGYRSSLSKEDQEILARVELVVFSCR